MYIFRLDDACSYMDEHKWKKIEELFFHYEIKPIVAVIPDCQDEKIIHSYKYDNNFWMRVRNWQESGWTIALHGYNHVYSNMNSRGLNPINKYSEFSDTPLEEQRIKIRKGLKIFNDNGVIPRCFVAPAHSFDRNTLYALELESDIRIISDTLANDVYFENGFYFIPVQSGNFRTLPFRTVTFCYHPNTMSYNTFNKLDLALRKHKGKIGEFDKIKLNDRKFGFYDSLIRKSYFFYRNRLRKIYSTVK